jgi:cytoskeleton protein RodZ
MAHGARNEFGAHLKQAREQKGVTLQQVAATTKISARFLDALEKNDQSRLPGGIFSRSFVRSYAREVGLDPEDTVRRFVEAFPPESEEAEPAAASRAIDAETYESGRRAVKILLRVVGVVIVGLAAALVYWKLRATPAAVPPPVADPPAVAQPASVPAAPVPTGQGTETQPAPEATAATPLPAPGTQAPATGGPEPTATAPSVQQAQAESSTEAVTGPDAAPLTVSIFASDACWLSLSVDGRKVIGRNLEPGERVQFRARAAINLVAGNAGALTVTINGKPARPLGERGAVVTTAITLDSYKSLLL